ncbi:hypothetical protein V8C40DRAFT_246916 [Trichoderma camerunense]
MCWSQRLLHILLFLVFFFYSFVSSNSPCFISAYCIPLLYPRISLKTCFLSYSFLSFFLLLLERYEYTMVLFSRLVFSGLLSAVQLCFFPQPYFYHYCSRQGSSTCAGEISM